MRKSDLHRLIREFSLDSPASSGLKTGSMRTGLGLATVTLPDGWETRLKPLLDEDGVLVACCLDIYDLASAKLVAGREKDLDFRVHSPGILEALRKVYDAEILANELTLCRLSLALAELREPFFV